MTNPATEFAAAVNKVNELREGALAQRATLVAQRDAISKQIADLDAQLGTMKGSTRKARSPKQIAPEVQGVISTQLATGNSMSVDLLQAAVKEAGHVVSDGLIRRALDSRVQLGEYTVTKKRPFTVSIVKGQAQASA